MYALTTGWLKTTQLGKKAKCQVVGGNAHQEKNKLDLGSEIQLALGVQNPLAHFDILFLCYLNSGTSPAEKVQFIGYRLS
jgi:hypothetical protein